MIDIMNYMYPYEPQPNGRLRVRLSVSNSNFHIIQQIDSKSKKLEETKRFMDLMFKM